VVLPRIIRVSVTSEVINEDRMKRRLDEINSVIKTHNFYDWLASQRELNPQSLVTSDTVW
jgi:hypothetical protein